MQGPVGHGLTGGTEGCRPEFQFRNSSPGRGPCTRPMNEARPCRSHGADQRKCTNSADSNAAATVLRKLTWSLLKRCRLSSQAPR